jgi:Protein of unknown function (DUF2974).
MAATWFQIKRTLFVTNTTGLTNYALFAQDSYNRADLSGASQVGDYFNGALIVDVANKPADGFYAVAYDTGTEIVIAYRGTDGVLSDAINGWGGGAGLWFSDQNQLAVEFFHEVNAAYPGRTITVTGHSLGGGLAGFVSCITGVAAHVFDNMPYELSANIAYLTAKIADTFTNLTGITAAQINSALGDVLSALGFSVSDVIGETGKIEIDVGIFGFSPVVVGIDALSDLFALAEAYYSGQSGLSEGYAGVPVVSPGSISNVTQYAIDGEVLELLRNIANSDDQTVEMDAYFGGGYRFDVSVILNLIEAGAQGFATGAWNGVWGGPQNALLAGASNALYSVGQELVEELIVGTIELMINKHSMSLMTANTYLHENFSATEIADIGLLGGSIFSHLFDDGMANRVGIFSETSGDAAALLLSKIAYSAATGERHSLRHYGACSDVQRRQRCRADSRKCRV